MNSGRWQGIVDALVSVGVVDYGSSLEGFLYDPGSHSWRARLHQTMWGMGAVIALILVGVGIYGVVHGPAAADPASSERPSTTSGPVAPGPMPGGGEEWLR